MFIAHIFTRTKSLLLTVFAVIRRAFCCFSRQRKRSYSECEVLSSVNVVQNNNYQNTRSNHRNEVERDWNSWDDTPQTVQEHIENYRQRLVQPKQSESEEQAIDFFQDMTPKVMKQKKIFLDTDKKEEENFTRLQATSTVMNPHVQSAELEDWSDENDEGGETGWNEIDDEATKAMIREKRKELRRQRHQKQQQRKILQAQMQQGFAAR